VKRLAAAAYGGDPDDLESFVRGGEDECLVQRLDYVLAIATVTCTTVELGPAPWDHEASACLIITTCPGMLPQVEMK